MSVPHTVRSLIYELFVSMQTQRMYRVCCAHAMHYQVVYTL